MHTKELLNIIAATRLLSRVEAAETVDEYDGYLELYRLAQFCYFDRFQYAWGFSRDECEV